MYRKWTVRGLGIALPGLLVVSVALAGERPATERPVLSDRIPAAGGLLPRDGGQFAFPAIRREARNLFQSTAAAAPGTMALRRATTSGFSDLVMNRMHRELERLDPRDRDDLGRMTPAWAGREDSRVEQLRASQAERIITGAFDRAVDVELERWARNTAGLGEAWDWVETLGRRTRSAAFGGPDRQDSRDGGSPAPLPRFTAGIGLKVAAHPRMTVRTNLFGIVGRIDIPLRNEPITISFDRALGERAHVRLSSSLSRRGEYDDWVNLSLRLGF